MKNRGLILATGSLSLVTAGIFSIVNFFRARVIQYIFSLIRGESTFDSISVLYLSSCLFKLLAFVLFVIALILLLNNKRQIALLIYGLASASYLVISTLLYLGGWLKVPQHPSAWSILKSVYIGNSYGLNIDTVLSYGQGIVSILLIVITLIALITSKSPSPVLQPAFAQSSFEISHEDSSSFEMQDNQIERSQMENNTQPQWKVKLPGQPDQAVDTATLQMWARSGVIRPDTLILDVANNMTYSASQIPTIFSTKSYVTAMLLSFFLGYLGVDRFYLGHTGIGIGKLLTFGGCGIWSLIDFILIAMRKVTDSQGNPLA